MMMKAKRGDPQHSAKGILMEKHTGPMRVFAVKKKSLKSGLNIHGRKPEKEE